MQTPRTLITSWCLLLYASIRAWLAPHACCRFHPTCSAYWAEACQRHGFFIGCLLTGKRLLRCHPWTKMQVDPVPTHIMPSRCHQTVTSEEEPNS